MIPSTVGVHVMSRSTLLPNDLYTQPAFEFIDYYGAMPKYKALPSKLANNVTGSSIHEFLQGSPRMSINGVSPSPSRARITIQGDEIKCKILHQHDVITAVNAKQTTHYDDDGRVLGQESTHTHWLSRVERFALRGQRSGGGKRGKVSTFSKSSRLRMLSMFHRLDYHAYEGNVLFLTTTYNDSSAVQLTPKRLKRDVDTFGKRFLRAYPNASLVWRVELAKRKTGWLRGLNLPHVHYVVLGVPHVNIQAVRDAWSDVIGASTSVRVNVRAIEEVTQLKYYVSKYSAKHQPTSPSRGAPIFTAHPSRGGASNLVCDAYLTADDKILIDDFIHALAITQNRWLDALGRHWGVIGRKNVTYAKRIDFDLYLNIPRNYDYEVWNVTMRRYIRRFRRAWGGRLGGQASSGWRIFTTASDRWAKLILYEHEKLYGQKRTA
jgi:hypothetical protein